MNTPLLRIAPEGMSIVGALAVAGWLSAIVGFDGFSLLILVAFGFAVFFFRDPERQTAADDGTLVSPSDGRVIEVKTEPEDDFLRREVTRVSIFLSIFDCHVNWFPVSGEVAASEHIAGKFFFGFSESASKRNERLATLIKPDGGGPEILMAQVAGFVARRIVSHAPAGAHLKRGQRFGIIKFGSRIDLFFPAEYGVEVSEGDLVRGAETPIARLLRDGKPQ